MKHVVVPQHDLDNLEQSRKDLFQLFENMRWDPSLLLNITGAMWQLTHRRYKEVNNKYVLVFVDDINCSFGPQSITDHQEIVAVGESVMDLMYHEQCKGLDWEHVEDSNQYVAFVKYDGEVEQDQRYMIIEVG